MSAVPIWFPIGVMEKAHTDNQHQGSDKKGQEKIRLHRGNVQAQKKDDNNDW